MSTFIPRFRPAVSLKRHSLWLLAGVVGLFAAGIALSLWVSLQSSARSDREQLELEVRHAQVGLARLKDYYRALLDNVVRAPELADLMRFGSVEAQQEWALARQRLLPDLLGFALLGPGGEVRGEASALRVGPRCIEDMRRAADLNTLQPLMHDEVAGLEHIDLVAMVREPDGRTLGGVFISLRLDQLQRVIDDARHPDHALILVDAAGRTLVRSGIVEGRLRELRLPVTDTGWTLVAQSPVRLLTRNGEQQALVGLLTLAAVLTLLGATLVRLRRTVLRDVDATRDALAALAREEPVPEIVPHYAEFEPAVADINRIALNLQDQRVRLEYLSLTDPLTGLPNRRAFENHFAQAQGLAAREHRVALVLLDIDYFKVVNDTLGHGVGDQVLRALAESLKGLTRRADLAARLAGDEFVVLLTNVEAGGLEVWYQRLADRFRSELGALGMELKTGLSAGQTWLRKTPDDTLGEALARADRALYRAKAHGRGQLATEAGAAE
ncbi:MAG: GGDEF domain-containing protein [Pseudomonadota bacterium]